MSFTTVLPADKCCSACMRNCISEKSCESCDAKLKKFEPVRNNINVSKNSAVKYLKTLLCELDVNEKTPEGAPLYDTSSLAEAIVSNALEHKSFDEFKEFLGLFTLGNENTNILLDFVKTNFSELCNERVSMENILEVVSLKSEDSDSESYDSSSSCISRL